MRLLTFYNSEVDPLPSAARAALVPARVLYPHLKCDYGDDDGDDDDDGGDVGFSPSWLTYFPAVLWGVQIPKNKQTSEFLVICISGQAKMVALATMIGSYLTFTNVISM